MRLNPLTEPQRIWAGGQPARPVSLGSGINTSAIPPPSPEQWQNQQLLHPKLLETNPLLRRSPSLLFSHTLCANFSPPRLRLRWLGSLVWSQAPPVSARGNTRVSATPSVCVQVTRAHDGHLCGAARTFPAYTSPPRPPGQSAPFPVSSPASADLTVGTIGLMTLRLFQGGQFLKTTRRLERRRGENYSCGHEVHVCIFAQRFAGDSPGALQAS